MTAKTPSTDPVRHAATQEAAALGDRVADLTSLLEGTRELDAHALADVLLVARKMRAKLGKAVAALARPTLNGTTKE